LAIPTYWEKPKTPSSTSVVALAVRRSQARRKMRKTMAQIAASSARLHSARVRTETPKSANQRAFRWCESGPWRTATSA
jgi:hypothetical protein